MTPELLYKTANKIWRLQVNEEASYMVLEVRNEEYREATFTAIDWHAGEVLWEDGELEEPWWLSLAAVINDKLLVHLLKDTQEPSPKGLICLDILQGEGLWELEGYVLEQSHANHLVCTFKGEAVNINLQTGERVKEMQESAPIYPAHILPSRYLPEEAYFNTVASFLKKKFEEEAVGAIDYWEGNSWIVISYYTINDIYYDNHLVLLNSTGECLHRIVLNKGAKGIGTESFGLLGAWLFYIEEKQSLYRINLA